MTTTQLWSHQSKRSTHREYTLDVRTSRSDELVALRLARYVLAQYIKTTQQWIDEDLVDPYHVPWDDWEWTDVLHDHDVAIACLAAITPLYELGDDSSTYVKTSYDEHLTRVLTIADLTRDKTDESDEARRLERIYKDYDYCVHNDDDARRMLLDDDDENQRVMDRWRPASLREAFTNLMSLEFIGKDAREAFWHALLNWQLPAGMTCHPREPIDTTTSLKSQFYIKALRILQACACPATFMGSHDVDYVAARAHTKALAAAQALKSEQHKASAASSTPPSQAAASQSSATSSQ